MEDLFEQMDGAYEQTGTDLYEDAYSDYGEIEYAELDTYAFLQNLDYKSKNEFRPKTWKQRNPRRGVRSINFYLEKTV